MAKPVIMPKLGQTVEESTIVQWLKKEGDQVQKGDVLLEIETDKATLEVESFVEGILLRILRGDGDTVPVMEVIGYVGEPGESLPELPKAVAEPKARPPVETLKELLPSSQAKKERTVGEEAPPPVPRAATEKRIPSPPEVAEALPPTFRISPRAAKLAKDSVIDPRRIRGSGPWGRVIERDVRDYLLSQGYDQIKITPAAKRLAAQHQLDLLTLRPGEDGDRIDTADVRRVLSEQPKPLPRMRQVIAERMTRSFTTTPHFYVTVSADMSDLLELRSKAKKEGKDYSLTDFVMKAVALALPEFPLVNSSTSDGKQIRSYTGVHLGMAVAVEQGLLVPVVRHADRLRLSELHSEVEELVRKAREGTLTPDEMTGGTFTISNMGMLDVENFAAIINPGESSILAVSSIIKSPVVRDDQIVIRSLMKMTLSADHRLVDGALGARFVNVVKAKLEDLGLWKRLI
jgi:pyruvate dehydrogenase E2 component (dihydrolipoamide acetyltransferase)